MAPGGGRAEPFVQSMEEAALEEEANQLYMRRVFSDGEYHGHHVGANVTPPQDVIDEPSEMLEIVGSFDNLDTPWESATDNDVHLNSPEANTENAKTLQTEIMAELIDTESEDDNEEIEIGDEVEQAEEVAQEINKDRCETIPTGSSDSASEED